MDDLISRQAVIEINRSYHGQMPNEVNHRIWKEINELPSAEPETHEERTETHACDCIDRQAAINTLHDEIVRRRINEDSNDDGALDEFDTEAILRRLPSAQPEIIRCKGCKHQVKEWRTDKRLKNKGYMVCGCEVVGDACGYWALLGQDDDYCSMAERRTDE